MNKLLLGTVVFFLMASCNGNTESVEDYEEHKEHLIEWEKMVEGMTEQEKQDLIITGERVLDRLQKEIESDSINPESRFQKKRSIKLIKKELDIVRKSM